MYNETPNETYRKTIQLPPLALQPKKKKSKGKSNDDNYNNNESDEEDLSREVSSQKPKTKRVITQTNKWNMYLPTINDFCAENQWKLLGDMIHRNGLRELEYSQKIDYLRNQVQQKLHNYKAQDIKKGVFDKTQFISMEYILCLLQQCKLSCFYCKEQVQIWYEHSREPKQWTVERIQNEIGHNVGNVEIACLSCNLKRRCMYHERFVFTKQIKIVKTEGNSLTDQK